MAAAFDKLPLGRLAVYVFAGGALCWVIFLALQILYFSRVESLRQRHLYENRDNESHYREVQVLEKEQRKARDSYRWVDREKELVGIPVQEAMELILKEWKGN